MASPRNTSRPPRPGGSEEHLEPGTLLNERYRIDVPIGQGAMGTVYAAEHVLLRKKVAVKILHGDRALVPEVVARFEREAMAAANIEHPNIAGASDFGRLADGSVYLVLEFVQGRNLRDEISGGRLPVGRSLHIARQVCSALAAAEELGIVHRDLKPENVMLIEKLGDPDFVKVLDFGIARVPMAEGNEEQPLTKVGIVFGTPEYMSPEQALGQRVDGRADLFALGVILFEMLTGTRPYANPKNPVLKLAQKAPRLSDRVPGEALPPRLDEVIQKLLAPDVRKRFQKAALALAELDALLSGEPQSLSAAPGEPGSARDAGSNAPRMSADGARLPTFLPGDPLPAFELPSETALPAPEPPTLLRAPKAETPSSAPPPALPAREPSSPPAPAGSLKGRILAVHRSARAFVDANREQLPRPLRRRLKRVPSGTLVVAAAGLFALVLLSFVLVVVAVVRSPEPGEARTDPASKDAPTAALAPAPAPSLEEASPTPPVEPEAANDPRSLVALAKTRLAENNDAEALALVGRALAADPKLAEDETVVSVLSEALHSDNSSSVDAAFALLEGPMGPRGAEAVYDAAFDPKLPQKVRSRASAWLKTKAFDRASSPALYSAMKLRLAESCEQKYGLLKLAENVGGKQTLAYLHELEKQTRCRPQNDAPCYACLDEGGRLRETIARLERRLGT